MAKAPVEQGLARDPEVVKAQNRVDANRLTQTSMQMDPSEDFSPATVERRDLARGYQEMSEWQRLTAQAAEADKQFKGPYKNSAGANPAGGYRERAAALVAYSVSRREGVIQRYPTLQRALVEAVAAGADVSEQDILRLTNYAEADRAATAYMNAPLESQRKNILLSMSPVQRAATLDVVAQKAADLATQLETSDTNFLQAGLGAAVGAVLEPFVWANETTQQAFRAGLAGTGDSALGNYAGAVINPLATASNIFENWDDVERGQFDEEYLQTLRDSGEYSPLAVDIVAAISKKQAEGDPDPLISVVADPQFANNPEADLIFRGLIYRPDEDENLMELVRQVDSANMGSTGQLYVTTFTTPDSSVYSDYRGLKGREAGANAASVFYSFALDPTIAGAKVIGAYRAARYALTKLAPGAKGGAAAALRSQKVAGVETNAARKAVQSFVDDLVKYDDLVARDPAKAATLRTVIARQHKEFPEDVIDEFQKQGIRTVDDFAAFVDETNDAFLLSRGEPTLAASAVTRAGESNFAREPLAMRMSARGDMGRREALMPRSGPVKRLRQTAVQRISAVFAPQARGRQTIDNFYGNTDDVEQVTQRLGENALDAGMADQSQALLGKGALGRRVDGFTRLFSSLPSVNHITTFDARDAGQFYKFARTYLTRQNATFLTNAFRDGNPAQRRLMVAGLIRTSAAARGVSLSKGEALAGIDDLATGWRVGERYSATRQLRATPDVADDTVTVYHYGQIGQWADTPPNSALGNIQGPGLYTHTDEAFVAQHSASRTDGAMTSFSVPKSVVAERTLDMAAPVDARARRIAAAMEEAFVREVGSPSGVEFPAYAPTFMVARTSLVDDYARALRKARGIDDSATTGQLDDISFEAQARWGEAVKSQGYAGTRLARDGGDEVLWLEDPRSFAAASKTPEQIVEDTIQYRPSNFDGEEHALHLWQTTQAVAIPSIRDLEALKRYRELAPFNLADGALTRVPQQATDFWSAWTLAGLRFSVRSAVEDLWVYAVTKGSMPFLYAGRRASTGVREARAGSTLKRYKNDTGQHKAGELVLDADGNATVIVRSRLGMFGKRARKIGDSLAAVPENRVADVLGVFFLQNLDENAVLAAQAAARAGDMAPLSRLAVEAVSRTRLNGLSSEQLQMLGDLVETPFGLKYLDEVAEAGQFLSRGTMPVLDDTKALDIEGMTSVKIPERQATVLGGFKDVSGDDWRFGTFWFNSLEGIVSHDGPIGKIAVANLYNRDQAIARIAEAIRSDTKFGYQTQFSALYTGKATVEQFAARYYDDVRNMFSGPDGSINAKLFERLAPKDADGVRQVGLHDIGEDGERTLRITPNGMGAFRKDGAPEIVLGRESIPAPTEDLGSYISGDRMFTWMGEQYARISKEPLFIANYLEQRGINKAYQAQLAERIGEKAANKIVAKMSADRAYGFVLSYTDNPANRSQLAWKVRNVSRYYRATEDFYRRMQRVAKNYPEAFWKTALTYDVLDDTGFVFTDDNGDKYFAYPGNEFLQSAVTTALGGVFGMGDMGIDPYFIGGKVKMLAPSTDPNQAFPQMMGPIGVIPMKMLFDKFPAIKGFERYVLGEYSAQSEWWDAMFPGQVARILGMLTVDERESLYGSAIKDALAIAVSQDLLKDKSFEQDGITSTDQLLQGNMEEWRLLQKIAMGGIATKALMGFFPVPASPQLYVDNVTLFARAHGLDNMRDGFLDSVAVFEAQGSANPFGDAIAKWWALHPDGDLMPFTVSKTGKAEGKINALADVQSVVGLQAWWKDNKELYREFPNAALFLAPRTGEFSWGAYDLVTSTLGLRVGKDFDTFAMDVLVADDQSQYFATFDDYQRDIDALNPATDGEKIKQLQAERSADLNYLKSNNPLLARAMKQDWDALDQNAQEIYNQTKQMTQAMFDRGTATAVSTGIANAIATYEDYMSDITAISGSTDAEDEYKRNLKLGLEADLAALAGKDENVAHFVDTVLKRTPEFQKAAG